MTRHIDDDDDDAVLGQVPINELTMKMLSRSKNSPQIRYPVNRGWDDNTFVEQECPNLIY